MASKRRQEFKQSVLSCLQEVHRSVGGVLNVVFSEELLLSAAASVRQRYRTALDEKRRENEATRRSERKRSFLEEISTLK